MERVEEKWEKDFTIVGATAIEDKLQDRVCRPL
jgi:magnesium-transporting ATPase (P-type)